MSEQPPLPLTVEGLAARIRDLEAQVEAAEGMADAAVRYVAASDQKAAGAVLSERITAFRSLRSREGGE